MDRYPAAYIRRSVVTANSPGDISYADQDASIRALAHRDGANGELRVFVDWDRSGDDAKVSRRREFARLIRAVEAGEVAALYGAKLDRLGRSIVGTSRLLAACKAHDVRVVTVAEGDLSDDGNPARWAYTTLIAFFSEYELRMAKSRSQGAAAARRQRGDHMGPPPYGYRVVDGALVDDPSRPVDVVLDAFRAAGTFSGAAAILNRDGIPTRNGRVATDGHPVWWANSVANVVRRVAPGLVPPRVRRGAPAVGHFRLAGLLTCGYCRRTLTPKRDRGSIYYVCGNANRDASHPRPLQIAESRILPAVRAEADHLWMAGDAVQMAADAGAERAAVTAQRERLGLAFARGAIAAATFDVEDAKLAARLAVLDDAAEPIDFPMLRSDEWSTWAPADVNDFLRRMFRDVRLGADMMPAAFVWRNPALRAD